MHPYIYAYTYLYLYIFMNVQMFGKPTRPFPPLPKKMMIGNQARKVIEERQVCIESRALFQN